MIFSLHTLKKSVDKSTLLSFQKKKSKAGFSSLQKSVYEENCGLKVVNPSLQQLRFRQALTSEGREPSRGSSMEENLFIGKVTGGTNVFSFCEGLWKERIEL